MESINPPTPGLSVAVLEHKWMLSLNLGVKGRSPASSFGDLWTPCDDLNRLGP